MAYNRHIDHTEQELRELRKVYGQDSIDRFFDGLISGEIRTEEQVIEFTNQIRESDGKAQLEYSKLKKLSVGFIDKYATNFNKRYDMVQNFMNRMRSSMSRGLKMLEEFCEKKRRKGHSKSKYKVVGSSKMGKGPYTRSLWGLEHCRDSVLVLYHEVCNYKENLNKNIDLCLQMIDQVNYVRSHPDLAEKIYDRCHKETVNNSRVTIRRFISLNANLENDLLSKMKEWELQKKALKNLKAKLYHTLDEAEWGDLCICDEVMNARRQGITNVERALWGDNKQQVMRVRVVIEHFDELNPEGQDGRIGGKFLAHLFYWCNILPKRGLEYWYTYFVDSYTPHGKLTPVKTGAVKAEKTKMLKEPKEEREKFNQMFESLVKKYMVDPEDMAFEDKEAVNF